MTNRHLVQLAAAAPAVRGFGTQPHPQSLKGRGAPEEIYHARHPAHEAPSAFLIRPQP